MTVQTSFSEARANLGQLLDQVVNDCETVIIKRKGTPDVALIAADELASLKEAADLLRSPQNALRRLPALQRAQEHSVPPTSVEELLREFGLEREG
jgi:antitoxin YefM